VETARHAVELVLAAAERRIREHMDAHITAAREQGGKQRFAKPAHRAGDEGLRHGCHPHGWLGLQRRLDVLIHQVSPEAMLIISASTVVLKA